MKTDKIWQTEFDMTMGSFTAVIESEHLNVKNSLLKSTDFF